MNKEKKMDNLQTVPVYSYYEDGDKIKKKVTGYAELVLRDVREFKEKTIIPADIMKPLVCREFCDKNKRCHLIEEGIGDLCKYHDKHGMIVKHREPEYEKIDITFPESETEREIKVKWEDMSVTPFLCPSDDVSEDEKTVIEVTRKQIKNWNDDKEAKRREKFIDKRGIELKQKLQDMQFRNPARAKEYAAKLSMNDWIAINQAGGLASA